MKALQLFTLSIVFITLLISCGGDEAAEVTPTANFTATIGTTAFSSNSGYILPSLGGTIAVLADDGKGNSFSIAIFEKDFPVNTAKNIAFSPSISYTNAAKVVFIAKSGTMTITAYDKNAAGVVNGITGTFDFIGTGKEGDLNIKNGKFNVKRK